MNLHTSLLSPAEGTTVKMRLFLVLLALTLASSDKLDRTYLPPPGSKYAGGDIEPPFEFVKKTYPDAQTGLLNAVVEDTMDNLDSSIGKSQDLSSVIPGFDQPFQIEKAYNTIRPMNPGLRAEFPLYNYLSSQNQPTVQQNFKIPGHISTHRLVSLGNSMLDRVPNHEHNVQSNFNQPPEDMAPYGKVQDVKQKHGLVPHLESTKPVYIDQQKSIETANLTQERNSNYKQDAFGFNAGKPMVEIFDTLSELQTLIRGFGEPGGNNFPLNDHINNRVGIKPLQDTTYDVNELSNDKPKSTDVPTIAPVEFPKHTDLVDSLPDLLANDLPKKDVSKVTISARPDRPQADADRKAVILNYVNTISPEGFTYSYDTSNGIHADESGTATDGVKAQGSYSYKGDDGVVYSIIYSADENGFQPRGDHLPTPPPVPEAIKQVIELTRKENNAGIFDDGSYDEAKYGHEKYHGTMDRLNSQLSQGLKAKGGQKRPTSTFESTAPYEYEAKQTLPDSFNGQYSLMQKENAEQSTGLAPGLQHFNRNRPENRLASLSKTNLNISKLGSNFEPKPSTQSLEVSNEYDEEYGYEYITPQNKLDQNKSPEQFTANEYSSTVLSVDDETTFTTPHSFIIHDNETKDKFNKNYQIPFLKRPGYNDDEVVTTQQSFDDRTSEYRRADEEFDNERTASTHTSAPGIVNINAAKRPASESTKAGYHAIRKETLALENTGTNRYTGFDLHTPQTTNSFISSTTPAQETSVDFNESNEPSYQTTYKPLSYFGRTVPTSSKNRITSYISKIPGNISSGNKPAIASPSATGIDSKAALNANVDGFGRPITTSEPVQDFFDLGPTYGLTGVPERQNSEVTQLYSDVEFGLENHSDGNAGPNIFVEEKAPETSNSTKNITGEDFSGPKQPQRYDSETGYYYK